MKQEDVKQRLENIKSGWNKWREGEGEKCWVTSSEFRGKETDKVRLEQMEGR